MYNTFECLSEELDGQNNNEVIKSCKNDEQGFWCRRWNRLFGTNYTSKQFVLISILSFGSICFGIAYSMQAPFFPSEAVIRGVNEKWVGFISGILDLGFTTGSILSGKLFTKFKPANILTTSLSFGGLNLIFFGSLQWINKMGYFKLVAVILRICIGIGMGSFFTGCFTIIFLEFSDSLSNVYATIEMCYAIGLIAGPVVGGFLFEIGDFIGVNFCLPFFVLGTFQLIVALVSSRLVNIEKKYENAGKGSFRKLLKNLGIVLNVVIYFNAGALLGFNTATLDIHLTDISTDLRSSLKGLIFLISGITYAFLNHFWGNLAEKLTNCYRISLIGVLSSLICLIFVGPLPYLPIDPNIPFVMVSQIFLGIGVSAILVGSFVQGFNETIKHGFSDSPSTTAILSSLFTTSESLGYAVSPIVGGYIMQDYGFRWATVPLFTFQVILIIAIIFFGIIRQK